MTNLPTQQLAYHTVRRSLADELGVDPGKNLRHLYAQILADRLQLTAHPFVAVPPVPRPPPADIPDFVGRVEELAQLDGLLENRPSASTIVSVIVDTAGTGKTALAAHLVAKRR